MGMMPIRRCTLPVPSLERHSLVLDYSRLPWLLVMPSLWTYYPLGFKATGALNVFSIRPNTSIFAWTIHVSGAFRLCATPGPVAILSPIASGHTALRACLPWLSTPLRGHQQFPYPGL
jgi:hypothetical protein